MNGTREGYEFASMNPLSTHLAAVRKQAVAEARAEIIESFGFFPEEDDGHAARILARSRTTATAKIERSRSFIMPRFVARPFEVVEAGGAVVAEHETQQQAELDAANRTTEFGITFKARPKRSTLDTEAQS